MMKSPTLGIRKPNFVMGLIIIKVNIERLERIIGKFLRNYFTLTIVSMETFYSIGLKEKEEYLY